MKKHDRPVYLQLRALVDPATGESIRGFVADHLVDARLLRQRGYRIGATVRAFLEAPRDVRFHRRAHMIGQLLKANIERFELYDAHDVFKKLQEETGVECDITEIPLPGLGIAYITEARSIAFDAMSQERFEKLVAAICQHICKAYWQTMQPDQIEQMAKLMIDT